MPAMVQRRAPGFAFVAKPPPVGNILPRMDIPVFVGFAASGPLHTPVPVEDPREFASIFGEDLPLAWDTTSGSRSQAHLPSCVRAFFRNGGRRCWIIRVAADSCGTNLAAIPGVLRRDSNGKLTPAFGRARSPGSWSDNLGISTTLTSRSIPARMVSAPNQTLRVEASVARQLREGDLLRFGWKAEGISATALVKAISEAPDTTSSPPASNAFDPEYLIQIENFVWIGNPIPRLPAGDDVNGLLFGQAAASRPVAGRLLRDQVSAGLNADSAILVLDLDLSFSDTPKPGEMFSLQFGADTLWLSVTERMWAGSASPASAVTRITAEGYWAFASAPSPFPSTNPTIELLTFDLWSRLGTAEKQLWDLGFGPAHPRYWAALPDDSQLFTAPEGQERSEPPENFVQLWADAANPRFPLAGLDPIDAQTMRQPEGLASYVPVAVRAVPELYTEAMIVAGTVLERDGLAAITPELFYDKELGGEYLSTLALTADYIRYGAANPRRLRGLHAAFSLEEATIIAVPDAVQPLWTLNTSAAVPPRFTVRPATKQDWARFSDCDKHVLAAPKFLLDSPPEAGRSPQSFALRWSDGGSEEGAFILEEAIDPELSTAAEVYRGGLAQFAVRDRSPGDYYFRVRALRGTEASEWSETLLVRVSASSRWEVVPTGQPEEDYSIVPNALADRLLAIQRVLLRFCASRGDVLALLSLPAEFRENSCVRHLSRLKSLLKDIRRSSGQTAAQAVPLFSRGEQSAFSFGACYHPWVLEPDNTGKVRLSPPDGVIAGIMARRSLERGAWVAPANELIHGAVAFEPKLRAEMRPDLQAVQLNELIHDSSGFICLSADTLSDDETLRPIGARRLLILLRRVALRLGADYVFEPNDDALRRLVQHGFEALLRQLFGRGAFAGRTVPEAFQVNTSVTLNTPQNVEQGRFLVEIRVAPSRPLTFVTLRLIQTNERGFVAELK
jgi:hypothetical protein